VVRGHQQVRREAIGFGLYPPSPVAVSRIEKVQIGK
jgi:hypothetical protein